MGAACLLPTLRVVHLNKESGVYILQVSRVSRSRNHKPLCTSRIIADSMYAFWVHGVGFEFAKNPFSFSLPPPMFIYYSECCKASLCPPASRYLMRVCTYIRGYTSAYVYTCVSFWNCSGLHPRVAGQSDGRELGGGLRLPAARIARGGHFAQGQTKHGRDAACLLGLLGKGNRRV